MLGQTLVNLLKKQPEKYQVFGLSRGANRSRRNDFVYHNIDITQKELLTACLQEIQPNCIVNTAAMTNVDACEEYKEECNRLNITVVESSLNFARHTEYTLFTFLLILSLMELRDIIKKLTHPIIRVTTDTRS